MSDWHDLRYRRNVIAIPVIWLAFVLSLIVHVAALWEWFPRIHLLARDALLQSEAAAPLTVRLATPKDATPESSPAPKLAEARPAQPAAPRRAPARPPRRTLPAPPAIALNSPPVHRCHPAAGATVRDRATGTCTIATAANRKRSDGVHRRAASRPWRGRVRGHTRRGRQLAGG